MFSLAHNLDITLKNLKKSAALEQSHLKETYREFT